MGSHFIASGMGKRGGTGVKPPLQRAGQRPVKRGRSIFEEEPSSARRGCRPYLSHDRGVPGGSIRAALVMSQFASRNPPTLSSDRIREGMLVP
jgi:hypothetical protein